MKNKRIIGIALVTALLLMVPLVGNWPWTLSDFVIMGVLLFGTGLIYELLVRKIGNAKHRAILGIVLAAAFFLTWAELAVGLFGSPFAGS